MVAELSQSLLRSLTPAQVRLFAVRAGWKPLTGLKRPGVVLNHPTDGLTQIHLPLTASDPDYAHRMRDAVLKLAGTENRDPAELLYELALPPADVMHLRLRSHDAEGGTLPLSLGVQLFMSGQSLLTAAACSAHHPQAYHKSTAFAPVTKFLERCRMGQSRNGNGYAATIAAPVTPDLQRSVADGTALPADEAEALTLADAPFERKVTLTLMQSLHTLRSAFDSGANVMPHDAVEKGVSSNLCDALTALSVEDQRAVLDVSMGWSKAIPHVPPRLAPPVSFAQPEFSFLSAIARELKRFETGRLAVQGFVTDLRANTANLFEEFEGTVTVRTELDGQSRSVRFALKRDEYLQACDAHRSGWQVSVSGVIAGEAGTKVPRLTQLKGFRILRPLTTSSS